jgi:hypothetical protein
MKLTLLLISALSLAANAANKVQDPKFGKLGDAITNDKSAYRQNDNWKVTDFSDTTSAGGSIVSLTSDDVVGRSDGRRIRKYDLYLAKKQKLSQVFNGLSVGRTYLLRIRAIANTACVRQSLWFGAKHLGGFLGHKIINSDDDDFLKGTYHQTTFVVTTAKEIEIFVSSLGSEQCKGPLIREVLLHMIST